MEIGVFRLQPPIPHIGERVTTSGSLEEIKRQLEQVFGPTRATASDFAMMEWTPVARLGPASHAEAGSAGYWDLSGG